ncbi:hypothetical protein CLPU_1c02640 [Gottschalkia purinilytica]|uniref:Uncharacterized protein n=1 Tax=Gottschalkia purinilytica TaxID=1503 RepID=A0A0L0WF51_GOTPU|nr:hypothetical protein [Gottschalkia purinilytica]KNF10099.1 hypothetical protein CLPU_1c02640 [Gottschalkia purinilytica]
MTDLPFVAMSMITYALPAILLLILFLGLRKLDEIIALLKDMRDKK